VHLPPFVLVDQTRAEQFALLGQARRLFARFEVWADGGGTPWAVLRIGAHAFAVTSLGPAWVFDPYAARRQAEALAAARDKVARATPDQHLQELAVAARRVRAGGHAERLLWLVHQQVLAARSSVIRVPDSLLAAALWGEARSARPRQWRRGLAGTLEGLTWLHLAEWPEGGPPPGWGAGTALLTHAADLRGGDADVCDEHCPGQGRTHHHFLVNAGRGLLGLLEQFGVEGDSGVRSYRFPVGGPKGAGPTLRKAGRAGRLVTVFLPAKLGDPAACGRLSAGEHRILQALVRETTRRPRRKGQRAAEVEVFRGSAVPDALGRGQVAFPGLGQGAEHVAFCGNGRRAGLAYYLSTPGGWAAKAGYGPDEARTFLSDLASLAGRLSLTVGGIEKGTNRCYDLAQLRGLASASDWRSALARVFVRVYTCADYVQRWGQVFGWGGPPPGSSGDAEARSLALAGELDSKGFSLRTLAAGVGADPSFISKLLRGQKPWPAALLARAEVWVAGGGAGPPPAAWPSLPGGGRDDAPVLELARAFLQRGWAVVPQRPGEKKPLVRWKRFQLIMPSEADWERWAELWPDAGLALVLGPVSGVFVIDVDGVEAHDALVGRLGSEPLAPKALSGSRKPCRYHLLFRCPVLRTKAKTTPWHPGLEFRGRGGIVVIPPSLHPSGMRYAWAEGRSPADLPMPEVPAEVLEALRPPPRPAPAAPAGPVPADLAASPSTRRFLAGAYADGPRWNDRLFRAACDLAGRGVPPEQAEPLLLAGARPWGAAEEDAARRTIASAYDRPREPGLL
jgi:hypothetical protein